MERRTLLKYEAKSLEFTSDSDYNVSMSITEVKKDFLKLKIKVDFGGLVEPKPTYIQWFYPICNVISLWTPRNPFLESGIGVPMKSTQISSRAAFGAPILTYYGTNGNNSLTIALADVLTPTDISVYIREDTVQFDCSVTLFSQRVSPMSEYETELILDMRDIPYDEAIINVSGIWSELGYKSCYVPDPALRPMYSTWYSYHQDLDRKTVVEELKLAKEYGMESVIVDDGWQTPGPGKWQGWGYTCCGDWEPLLIPDMKEFVEDVHNLGMKFMLWYSMPFVGKQAKAYDRFKDKLLSDKDLLGLGGYVLDPRYPDVRDYLVTIYEKAVSDWKLDGLKLDYVGSFALSEDSPLPNDEMDFVSLEEAICALLSETMTRLRKINPEILIEFRQAYMGPMMRTYGNMIRVGDCPANPLKNRVCSLSLRLTSDTTAVHSDMLTWNYTDTVENAALEIINILFAVPQISVLIEKLPEEHKKMMRFYLDFWNEHRDTLLYGKLTAKNPELNYSIVYSETDSELIAVSFVKNILDTEKSYDKLYFVNGAFDEVLIINNKAGEYAAEIIIYDCMGNQVETKKQNISSGYNLFNVPKSGMVKIKKSC